MNDTILMAAAAPDGQSGMGSLLIIIAMFVVFYFLLIRPQNKREKERQAMVGALQKGDEVVIGGSFMGKITKIGDNFLSIEIANGVEIKVQRHAISNVLPKGSLKSLD